MRVTLIAAVLAVAAPLSAQDSAPKFQAKNIRTERDPSRPGNPVVKVAFGCHSDAADSDLALLARFPELREVDLLSDKVSDAGLEHLKSLAHLETLRLNSSTITDKGLESVAALPTLKALVLYRTRATGEGLALLKRLPALRSLCLGRIPITADGVSSLKGMTALEKLSFEQLKPDSREKAAELVPLLPGTRVTLP